MECSVMQCEPIAQYEQINTFDYEIEQLKYQLENVKLQGLTGIDIKSQFHFHNNRACIKQKCSEITSNQNKSIVLKIENKQEKLPLPELDQDTKNDLEDMFKRMSLNCEFSFTLRIPRPENVTEKWLKVSIQSSKIKLPKNWKNPYLVKYSSPFDQLDIPYNRAKWKYCFEEFYYCEYVGYGCDTKQFSKLYSSELQVHIEEIAPSLNCPKCFELIRPGQLMKHVFKHLIAQLPKCDVFKYLCLHCLSPSKSTLDLLKHQIMVENTVTRFCCMICNTCFISEEKRVKHMQKKHTFNCMPYICQICPYRCSTAVQIAHHISKIHTDSITCPFCLTVFYSTENNLIENPENIEEKLEALENIYETVTNHLESHIINTHFFNCSQCQLTFNSKEELLNHKICGHGNLNYKTADGYLIVSMVLSSTQKLVVQKYNKRRKLAVFVNSELPIEEMGIKKINVRKFKKRYHHTQDNLIDYPLLNHLLKEKCLFKKRTKKFFGKKSLKFTKLEQASKSDEDLDNDISGLDFSNCFIFDDVCLDVPTKDSEKFICNECLEPLSKDLIGSNKHYNEEIIICDFPSCSFKTMCYKAYQMHSHDDLGTRKTPLVLLQKDYLSLPPEKHLWICTNCAEYFTDFKSLAHHVHEKNHVGFSGRFETNEISNNLLNNSSCE